MEAGGFTAADAGHVYAWYQDHSPRDAVDRAGARCFPAWRTGPPRHSVVTDLPEGVPVAVEVTAAKESPAA